MHGDSPIIMAGTVIPATNAMPTGAPTKVPSCHRIFFFLDQGFFPQKVHPEGLKGIIFDIIINNSTKFDICPNITSTSYE